MKRRVWWMRSSEMRPRKGDCSSCTESPCRNAPSNTVSPVEFVKSGEDDGVFFGQRRHPAEMNVGAYDECRDDNRQQGSNREPASRSRLLPLRLRWALKDCDAPRWRLLHCSDEAIPAPRNGFHVARIFGAVCEGAANLVDREIDSMLEVDECRISPEAPLDFFPGYDLTGSLDEKQQNAERLGLKLEQNAGLAQFA